MNKTKKAVILDKYIEDYSYFISMLKDLDFEIFIFDGFDEAQNFLINNEVSLIVSDLIVHEKLDGIENYINASMSKKNSFVLGTVNIESLMDYRMSIKDFSLFFEGMPKQYLLKFNPSKALEQIEVDYLIDDFKKKLLNLKNDDVLTKRPLLFFNFMHKH